MTIHITEHREGFPHGRTPVVRYQDDEDGMPISLSVLKLKAGETHTERCESETAWLLMSGQISGQINDQPFSFQRQSLFDDSPSCIHASAGSQISFECETDTELTIYACDNPKNFEAAIYRPEDVEDEPRGKGQVQDRCLRYVRTIFDGRNSDPNAALVLGEVITFQGGWSSYPPHHHKQPEIYHYRFSEPQGYGHGELGEDVLKVRNYDTVKIKDLNDHAQCAAPGYAMYYSWVIRHLPDNPYTVPEFTEEHRWIMQDKPSFWRPKR